MKLRNLIPAAVIAFGLTNAIAEDDFSLKGNVQTQVTKSIADDENNLSSAWIRANIGGMYKSENMDAQIMIRMFGPEFGYKNVTDVSEDGKATKTNQDKILADLYWVNYKLAFCTQDQINLKIGRWKTDWSQSTNFGTYIDKSLTSRGLWMRDYSHNALELGWKHGLSQLNVMAAIKDNKANTGYVRVEEDLKFTFPLDFKVAYRSNAIDVVQNTAYITHRMAAYASYSVLPKLRLYGEYGLMYTQDEKINEKAKNYVKPELGYVTPGDYIMPFYVGLEIPTFDILSNLMFELEYVRDRGDKIQPGADELAWTVALVKTIAKQKLQLSVYSEKEVTDVGIAFRLTSTIK